MILFNILLFSLSLFSLLIPINQFFILSPQFAHSAQVTLSWDANADSALAGYKLYVGEFSGHYPAQIDVGNHTTWTITDLQETKTYYMAVTAYGADGKESTFSNEVEVRFVNPENQRLVVLGINCGGSGFTGRDGIVYLDDNYFSGGHTYQTGSPIGNTEDDALYQSERFGNFAYNISLPNGDYWVTLKFAEIYYSGSRGSRIFDVFLQENRVISSLDLYAIVGKNNAYDVTLPASVINGVLNIRFQTIAGNAKVNGIVIQGE